MRSFNQYIKENTQYNSVMQELLEEIKISAGGDDYELLLNWIDKFEKNDPNTIIDALTDDSNIYDFYLKHQSDIDTVLNENNWFDKIEKTNSLYDVVINGTKEAIKIFVDKLKKEL